MEKENSRIGANFGGPVGNPSGASAGGIGYGQTQMSTSFSGATQSATLIPGLTNNQVSINVWFVINLWLLSTIRILPI